MTQVRPWLLGGVLACENAVIPYAVGVDIACRMKLSVLDVPLALIGLGPVGFDEPATAWIALGYLGAVSMFLGFFAWYAGLAMGGIARVSQVQLLQPMMSLVWASLFLHEHLDALIVVVALVVLASVAGSRRSAVA